MSNNGKLRMRYGGGDGVGGRGGRGGGRLIDWLIKLYFSTVKILAQRPTHISAVVTVLVITKTLIVKYYDGRI